VFSLPEADVCIAVIVLTDIEPFKERLPDLDWSFVEKELFRGYSNDAAEIEA
jgi:hypothetical protein